MDKLKNLPKWVYVVAIIVVIGVIYGIANPDSFKQSNNDSNTGQSTSKDIPFDDDDSNQDLACKDVLKTEPQLKDYHYNVAGGYTAMDAGTDKNGAKLWQVMFNGRYNERDGVYTCYVSGSSEHPNVWVINFNFIGEYPKTIYGKEGSWLD